MSGNKKTLPDLPGWGLQYAQAKVRADEAWVIGRGGGAKIVDKFSEQETSRTETEVESG